MMSCHRVRTRCMPIVLARLFDSHVLLQQLIMLVMLRSLGVMLGKYGLNFVRASPFEGLNTRRLIHEATKVVR